MPNENPIIPIPKMLTLGTFLDFFGHFAPPFFSSVGSPNSPTCFVVQPSPFMSLYTFVYLQHASSHVPSRKPHSTFVSLFISSFFSFLRSSVSLWSSFFCHFVVVNVWLQSQGFTFVMFSVMHVVRRKL